MSRKSRIPYISDINGGRWAIFLIALAMVSSMAIRQGLSSERISGLVQAAVLDAQETTELKKSCVVIQKVRFVWSDNGWPTLALVVDNLRMGPKDAECASDKSYLQAERIFIPIQLSSLFSETYRVGDVRVENAIVDVDRFNDVWRPELPVPSAKTSPSESLMPPSRPKVHAPPVASSRTWWEPGEFERISRQLHGLRFLNTIVSFERGSKKVYINELGAITRSHPESIDLSATFRMDPAVSYGENLPALRIQGVIKSDGAELSLVSNLAEGSIKGTCALHPDEGNRIDLEAQLDFNSIPISTLAPLFTKSGLIHAEIQPKFLWLKGTAYVHGPMQGLFDRAPLQLQNIQVEGESARLKFSDLVRRPDGSWEPFQMQIQNFNLKKAGEVLGLSGQEPFLSSSGVANGEVQSRGRGHYTLQVQLSDVGVQLSHLSRQATQTLSQARLEMSVKEEKLHGRIFDIRPLGGRFLGMIKLSGDFKTRTGSLDAELDEFQLDPNVENSLFATKGSSLAGNVNVDLSLPKSPAKTQLTGLHGKMKLKGLEGSGWKVSELDLDLRGHQTHELELVLKFSRGSLSLQPSARQYQIVKPIFLEQSFAKDGVDIDIDSGNLRWRKNESITWDKMRGSTLKKQVEFVSSGAWVRQDETVSGFLEVDYPSVRRMKWSLGGPQSQVELKEENTILSQLRAKGPIDDKVLGIK